MKKLLLLLLAVVALTGCEPSKSPYRYTETDQTVHVSWPDGSCWGKLDTYWHDRSYSQGHLPERPDRLCAEQLHRQHRQAAGNLHPGDSAWQKQ